MRVRFICIHGHFYQPPRENPWLEAVETQDTAHPYHDWNERVTAECYAPNASSRILDARDRITKIVNNYASISFNFGPTLLSWLEQREPDTYAAIIDADRMSRERFGGHGSAIAQVYNHMILPLANERDKRTQVRWGIRDFEKRFGRKPAGMWLPETAVDVASLEALAAEGIAFTILEPRQAARWRGIDTKDWIEGNGSIDPTVPYRCTLPSGRSISIFFYDGAIPRRQSADVRSGDRGEDGVELQPRPGAMGTRLRMQHGRRRGLESAVACATAPGARLAARRMHRDLREPRAARAARSVGRSRRIRRCGPRSLGPQRRKVSCGTGHR